MTTALELITNSLRHINVPGRGASLSAGDTNAAFSTLQSLLRSKAVSKSTVPGVRRHFFPLTSGQSVYKYGTAIGAHFDSSLFDDPIPIAIEDAYIRRGGTITTNEQVDQYQLNAQGTWTINAGAGTAEFIDGELQLYSGAKSVSQPITLTVGVTYDVTVDVIVNAGEVDISIDDGGGDAFRRTIDASGQYTFVYTHASATADELFLTIDDTTDNVRLFSVSILAQGVDRRVLGPGSDRPLKWWDQKSYNRISQKNNGGHPGHYLFERNYPLAEVRLDQQPSVGDILVMDVLVDRITPASITDTLTLHPDAEWWLEWELCYSLAGDYGKSLKRDQMMILRDARADMHAANPRRNRLRTDPALVYRRGGSSYDIEGGD